MPKILLGNVKGPKGEPGPEGPQGPQGETGAQGPSSPLINNFLMTTEGQAALDAALGPMIMNKINDVISSVDTLNLDLKSVGIFVTNLAATLTLSSGETLIPIDVTQVNDSSGNYTASGGAINISKPGVYIINAMAHGVLNPGDFVGVYLRTSNLSAYDNAAQTISNANSAAQQFLLNFSAIVKITTSTNVYLVGTSAMGNATIFPRTISPGTQIRITRLR